MPTIEISETRTMNAPATAVYAVIADYRGGHARIVPPKYFSNLTVLRGGTGAGTEITYQMTVGGQTREARAIITEPEPGRRLVETNEGGIVTTFTVDPLDNGRRASVTIHTRWEKPGLAGVIEKLLVPPMFRKIYLEELQRLEDVAKG